MDVTVEAFLAQSIFPNLDRGRPDWDKPHTQAVVHYAKEIMTHHPELNLDEDVIIISAYAHDWGYADLFEDGKPANFDNIKQLKNLHAEIGAKNIENLLKLDIFNYLSDSQKDRIRHLVHKHDKLDELKDTYELVLMEADTLGMLDVTRTPKTFDKESNDKFMAGVQNRRVPRFITTYTKQKYEELLPPYAARYNE